MNFFYGMGIGIFSVFAVIGAYKLYCVCATNYTIKKHVKQVIQEQQNEVEDTIQKLEDLANEED